ncbi:MAG: hypothetical protein LUP94_00780 [Candidatus Methanomethylicus sp.]|nr:hypothetical protein [Candidatus Methanomethylicus sp.]
MESAPFFSDLNLLADACITFYSKRSGRAEPEGLRRRRAALAKCAEGFHYECGTSSPILKDKLRMLQEEDCIVLMTAHQPNLFPYSGVLRKTTLIFALSKKLEERLGVPIVSLYGIADQDFTDDRWVRSLQLPACTRKDGVVEIKVDLPGRKMLHRVPKPPQAIMEKAKSETKRWLDEISSSVGNLLREMSIPFRPGSELASNMNAFMSMAEECYSRAESYSDFNSYLTSKVVNELWGYDTVFTRFSDCQHIFAGETAFFIENFEAYSGYLREAIARSESKGLGGGVSCLEPESAPFWRNCECGGKARLSLTREPDLLVFSGNCISCGHQYRLDIEKSKPMLPENVLPFIFPRSIPMILTFFKGFLPSCYVGGVGGMTYLQEVQHIAKSMDIPLPPIAIWRPRDRYLGVGQLEALLQLERMQSFLGSTDYASAKILMEQRIAEIRRRTEELQESKRAVYRQLEKNPGDATLKQQLMKLNSDQAAHNRSSDYHGLSRDMVILGNIPNTLYLAPSIIDYAVNIGIKETSEKWLQHLKNSGNLLSEVPMESVLTCQKGDEHGLPKYLIDRLDELSSMILKLNERSLNYEYDEPDRRE